MQLFGPETGLKGGERLGSVVSDAMRSVRRGGSGGEIRVSVGFGCRNEGYFSVDEGDEQKEMLLRMMGGGEKETKKGPASWDGGEVGRSGLLMRWSKLQGWGMGQHLGTANTGSDGCLGTFILVKICAKYLVPLRWSILDPNVPEPALPSHLDDGQTGQGGGCLNAPNPRTRNCLDCSSDRKIAETAWIMARVRLLVMVSAVRVTETKSVT